MIYSRLYVKKIWQSKLLAFGGNRLQGFGNVWVSDDLAMEMSREAGNHPTGVVLHDCKWQQLSALFLLAILRCYFWTLFYSHCIPKDVVRPHVSEILSSYLSGCHLQWHPTERDPSHSHLLSNITHCVLSFISFFLFSMDSIVLMTNRRRQRRLR